MNHKSVSQFLIGTVLIVHVLWCAWVLLGWLITRRRPVLRVLHIGSLIYAIIIEIVPWPPCPLTAGENWLEARANIEPQHGPFLVRLLDAVVYPDLPVWIVVGGAVVVCAGILAIYVRRYLHKSAVGEW